jgi:hypothetical protein
MERNMLLATDLDGTFLAGNSRSRQTLYELATARRPDALELGTMADVHRQALATYHARPELAADLLKVGEALRDDSLPAPEHAAMTIVANLILNLDEAITRE